LPDAVAYVVEFKRRALALENSMRFKQVRLENFKIFHRAQIDFRPLTLLTGANSSGKSTILNALTSILQTQPAHTFPFEYVPNGRHCQLGSFREIARTKSTRTTFGVGISVEQGNEESSIDVQYRYSASGNQILPKKIDFKRGVDGFELVWAGSTPGYKAIIHSKTQDEINKDKSFINFRKSLLELVKSAETKNKKSNGSLSKIEETIFGANTGEWFALKSRTAFELNKEITGRPGGQWVITLLSNVLKQLESDISYIAPVRAYPSRYYQSTDSGQVVDSSGKNAVSLLYEWKKHAPKKFNEVVKLLRVLELASRVSTHSSSDEILKLNVQPFHHNERVNLADVGFGLSQALPIVVADVALPRGGTLIINQPEVHLHPPSQAQLGSYLSSRVINRNYIIETHSEYLINRLRLLVSKEELNAKDVLIVFLEPPTGTRKTPKIHYITLEKDGSLNGAPKGFFQTYFLDTFNLAMNGFSHNV
jgi:predicted ATPase